MLALGSAIRSGPYSSILVCRIHQSPRASWTKSTAARVRARFSFHERASASSLTTLRGASHATPAAFEIAHASADAVDVPMLLLLNGFNEEMMHPLGTLPPLELQKQRKIHGREPLQRTNDCSAKILPSALWPPHPKSTRSRLLEDVCARPQVRRRCAAAALVALLSTAAGDSGSS